jgi:hypothetical protein
MNFDLDKAVNANQYVSQQIRRLRDQVEGYGDVASDAKIMTLFSRTNSDILEEIKKDRTMMQQFEASTNGSEDPCNMTQFFDNLSAK